MQPLRFCNNKTMTNAKDLVDALNAADLMALPQRLDPSRVSMSFVDPADNLRYFLTRVATGQVNEEGKAIYCWAKGKAMRPRTELNAAAPAPIATTVANPAPLPQV